MVNETMVAVGPTEPGEIDPGVIAATEVRVPEGSTKAEVVAEIAEEFIAKYQARGATIRQAVMPTVDRFQDPEEVDPVVDFSR